MTVDVSQRDLEPLPALVVRRTVKPDDLAAVLGEVLPLVFEYAQRQGLAFAGPPFTRYVHIGRGLLTIEAGLPTAVSSEGEGEIITVELPGGPAAVAIHVGPYDRLEESHVAIEHWIAEHELTSAGSPWESFITDPADEPDPEKWRTEIVHPLR